MTSTTGTSSSATTGSRQAASRRAGYTLLEMLLVLAVLVAAAAIVWPALGALYGDHELRRASEDVRTALAAARVRALDHGIVYQFRYEVKGENIVVLPFEPDELAADQTSSKRNSNRPTALYRDNQTFSERIRCEPLPRASSSAERLDESWLGNMDNARKLSQKAWSEPILFQPDGTATDAEFDLMNAKKQFIRVRVRGLTGAVTLSKVDRERHR